MTRSHPNWLKQVSQRHAQIPRPQKRSCEQSKIDWGVHQFGTKCDEA